MYDHVFYIHFNLLFSTINISPIYIHTNVYLPRYESHILIFDLHTLHNKNVSNNANNFSLSKQE